MEKFYLSAKEDKVNDNRDFNISNDPKAGQNSCSTKKEQISILYSNTVNSITISANANEIKQNLMTLTSLLSLHFDTSFFPPSIIQKIIDLSRINELMSLSFHVLSKLVKHSPEICNYFKDNQLVSLFIYKIPMKHAVKGLYYLCCSSDLILKQVSQTQIHFSFLQLFQLFPGSINIYYYCLNMINIILPYINYNDSFIHYSIAEFNRILISSLLNNKFLITKVEIKILTSVLAISTYLSISDYKLNPVYLVKKFIMNSQNYQDQFYLSDWLYKFLSNTTFAPFFFLNLDLSENLPDNHVSFLNFIYNNNNISNISIEIITNILILILIKFPESLNQFKNNPFLFNIKHYFNYTWIQKFHISRFLLHLTLCDDKEILDLIKNEFDFSIIPSMIENEESYVPEVLSLLMKICDHNKNHETYTLFYDQCKSDDFLYSLENLYSFSSNNIPNFLYQYFESL